MVADAARVLAAALPQARFLPALRRGNVNGALDMGLAPGLLPGRVSLAAGGDWFAGAWGAVPESAGLDAAGILASLAGGRPAGRRATARATKGAERPAGCGRSSCSVRTRSATSRTTTSPPGGWRRRSSSWRSTGHTSATVDQADVVLPAAVEHERPGTTTNIEGRVSRLGQKLVPPGLAWPDWMIAAELADGARRGSRRRQLGRPVG